VSCAYLTPIAIIVIWCSGWAVGVAVVCMWPKYFQITGRDEEVRK